MTDIQTVAPDGSVYCVGHGDGAGRWWHDWYPGADETCGKRDEPKCFQAGYLYKWAVTNTDRGAEPLTAEQFDELLPDLPPYRPPRITQR